MAIQGMNIVGLKVPRIPYGAWQLQAKLEIHAGNTWPESQHKEKGTYPTHLFRSGMILQERPPCHPATQWVCLLSYEMGNRADSLSTTASEREGEQGKRKWEQYYKL